MPLQKLQFRPGLNREGTDYSNEGGWYDGDKIRFRSGFPEKIGGWTQFSTSQFKGICRSLWNWVSLKGAILVGLGTSQKYYVENGTIYNDITPIYYTDTLVNPFTVGYSTLSSTISATDTSLTVASGTNFPNSGVLLIDSEKIYYSTKTVNTFSGLTRGYDGTTASSHTGGSNVATYSVLVTDAGYAPNTGDWVIYTGATAVGGITISGEYQVQSVQSATNQYVILAASPSSSNATGGGTVTTQYEYPIGLDVATVGTGWGIGPWGVGGWGSAYTAGIATQLRLWSNDNYGEDLVIAPRGGAIYYWQPDGTYTDGTIAGLNVRAKSLSSLADSAIATSTTATFILGATTITVTSSSGITIGAVVTGTNIASGTRVTAVAGTSVTISLATTGASAGTYSFSYAGNYVPTKTNQVVSSSIQRFIIAFGANSYIPGTPSSTFNPMLVRWSDQNNQYQWIPDVTNQAGEFALSNGSYIMAARSTRQEILVWTDSAIYSMQYLGAPYVWGFQILMDNISCMSPNAMVTVNNVTYWMGREKFYMYSGRVETLPCSLRQYIFEDINVGQAFQVFAGANEAYNEVWWFYVSESSGGTTIDKYVIYNYVDRVWYYGSMARSAWLNTGILQYPIAADYNYRLLNHEDGNDDASSGTPVPITAYVQSSDFDIGDGHNFGFVWRILPDVNFNGSSANQPAVTMTVKPRQNSGTPYGTADNPTVTSANNYITRPVYTVQEFTGQVYTRLRGRQMSFRIESDGIGVAWQLGSPRIDIRPDGRR